MHTKRLATGAAACLAALLLSASPAAAVLGVCAADLDGDGVVGPIDLIEVLRLWGKSHPSGDVDGDGIVGCFDQEAVLGTWGDCPLLLSDLDGDGDVDLDDKALLERALGTDCRFDLDGSGTVTTHDVTALLCLLGTASPAADFNGDGKVNGADLAKLLHALDTDCKGDLNKNGLVEGTDVLILGKDIGG